MAKRRRYDGIEWWDAAHGAKWGEQDVMELAAAKGDLDLIKWLRSQDPPCEWRKRLARQQPGETAGTSCANSSAWVALLTRRVCLEWLPVTQTGTVCPTQIGTKSLKFSSGLIVNTDAISSVIGYIRMFEKRSQMPVSALFFHSMLFSYH